MAGPGPYSGDDAFLLNLLRAEIRRELKADLMKVAEERVDAAVDAAVAGLEVQISSALSRTHGDRLVQVLVERVRPKAGEQRG